MQITPQQYRQLCPMRKIRRHIRRTAQRTNKQIKINAAKATLKLTCAIPKYKGINILRVRLKNRSAYLLTTTFQN